MKNKNFSRRQFLNASVLTAGGIAIGSKIFGAPAYIKNLGKPNSVFGGVQVGAITYSWRSMPSSAEQLLQYCIDANVSAIELMGPAAETFAGAPPPPPFGGPRPAPKPGDTTRPAMPPGPPPMTPERQAAIKALADWRASASMDKFIQLRKMYNDAGVKIYAWKPSALEMTSTDAEVDYAARAAVALGATHVTREYPTDIALAKRLADITGKHKIYVAYHGHLQQTIDMWDPAIAISEYNAMNPDFGHYVAAGFDPLELITAKHDHIMSGHIKDRKNKANGGDNMPWGEGDTPLPKILQLVKKNKYKFPVTIEMEYKVPDGSDATKEVAKCVEFARKALEA